MKTWLSRLLMVGTLLMSAQSFATVDDSNLWINANASGKIGEKTLAYMEVQPRMVDDWGHVGATLFRAALGYSMTDKWSLWGGYGVIPWNFPNSFMENRPYLQSTYTINHGRFTFINRTRMEFRLIENRQETALRARHLLRTLYNFDEVNKLFFVVWDELFYNFNTVPGSTNKISATPHEGFDQNRIFVGLGRKFGEKSNHFVEGGYLNQYVVRYEKPNASNHTLAFQYIYSF